MEPINNSINMKIYWKGQSDLKISRKSAVTLVRKILYQLKYNKIRYITLVI